MKSQGRAGQIESQNDVSNRQVADLTARAIISHIAPDESLLAWPTLTMDENSLEYNTVGLKIARFVPNVTSESCAVLAKLSYSSCRSRPLQVQTTTKRLHGSNSHPDGDHIEDIQSKRS